MTAITTIPTARAIHPSPGTYELPARDLQDLQSAPPIDRNQLLEQCVNNWNFALMLLDEFKKTSPSRLDAFDAALVERNHAAISAKAHGLKGVAGILAANNLMEICSNLESTTSHADWDQTRDLIQQLHHEMQRTIDDIPNIREQS